MPREPLRLAIAITKAIALVLNRDMYERTESNISEDVAESFSKALNVKISSETLMEKAFAQTRFCHSQCLASKSFQSIKCQYQAMIL